MRAERLRSSVREITVGHSPDADDAYMFYALVERLVPTNGVEFKFVLEEIDKLNARALRGELDLTAVSLVVYPFICGQYLIMETGASVGYGYGPRLVTRKRRSLESLDGAAIAVPGSLTTAAALLKMTGLNFREVGLPYDRVEAALSERAVEAALLIHEGQVSYEGKGFHLVIDLGAWWREKFDLPLPLGVNVLSRRLDLPTMRELSDALSASIDYAGRHRADAVRYASQFAEGLDEERITRFVDMYVNDATRALGSEEKRAMKTLLAEASRAGIVPPCELEFVF